MLEPSILILSSKYDFSSDYIVSKLRQERAPYLRINAEDLPDYSLELDPIETTAKVTFNDLTFSLSQSTLGSILYRRPVFLRDYGGSERTALQRLQQQHWSTFLRSLMIFDQAAWMNNPAATYVAEHKAIQLSHAHRVGFNVPSTTISNTINSSGAEAKEVIVAVKPLDVLLVREDDYESFGYTCLTRLSDIDAGTMSPLPAICQEALVDKIDIRVTIIGSSVFAAKITHKRKPISGDWRRIQREAEFTAFDLPEVESTRCRDLLVSLGLSFGAIDLALCGDTFNFLEINPTGEWAWLVDNAGLPIDKAISDWLLHNPS